MCFLFFLPFLLWSCALSLSDCGAVACSPAPLLRHSQPNGCSRAHHHSRAHAMASLCARPLHHPSLFQTSYTHARSCRGLFSLTHSEPLAPASAAYLLIPMSPLGSLSLCLSHPPAPCAVPAPLSHATCIMPPDPAPLTSAQPSAVQMAAANISHPPLSPPSL